MDDVDDIGYGVSPAPVVSSLFPVYFLFLFCVVFGRVLCVSASN